jgi:hypothetical protein
MSRKRKKDYVAVFASILDFLTPLGDRRVKELMMDFEAAMWQLYPFLNVEMLNPLISLPFTIFRQTSLIVH